MADLVVQDPGVVTLDGKELPGHFQELRIRGRVVTDGVKLEGRSGKAKQPKGWEDQEVRLRLTFDEGEETTALDQVREIHRRFSGSDRAARPRVYRLVNQHAAARGIDRVIFEELETRDRNRDDTIDAEVVLTEFRPVIVKKEQRVAKTTLTETAAANPYLAPGELVGEVTDQDWESVFDAAEEDSRAFFLQAQDPPPDPYGHAGEAVTKFRGVFERPSEQERTLTPQSPVVDDDDPWAEVEGQSP